MKKILTILITVLLITPLVGVFNYNKVEASELYPCSCDKNSYEVAYINDDGSFSSVGCYLSLEEAKNVMRSKGEDYVVRNSSSLSPTKIVAMNSGIVYSYPGRSGSNTMNIYQNASTRNIFYKQTYVKNHYEMRYIDTERYLPNLNGGIVEVELNGFRGFADIEYTDLVPDKYLDKGIGIYLGGNNNYDGENAFYVKPIRNYYEAINNGSYTDLIFHYSQAYPEKGDYPTTYAMAIGKAPSFMNIGTKYYSSDGVNFYSDSKQNNYVGTYYNYYQFLPLRSKTNISASVLENFLKSTNSNSIMINHCQDFIDEQNTYGVNGLLLFAMACNESAYGTSPYAKQRFNLFGWNAFDSNPGMASYFASVKDCINEQAGINVRGYIDITDGRFFSSSLGNKGSGMNVKYASDPYWGMKIASIAYKIDKYSCNNNGSYTDLNNYKLAKINTFDVNIKASANENSKTLYTTQYGPYYQQDFIVIVLEKGNTYTKIQSTNAIDNNGNIKTHCTPITTGSVNPISTYDFNNSVAYINNNYLNYINNEEVQLIDVPDDNLEMMSVLDSLSINNNTLNISGCAFIKGMSHTTNSNVNHKILIKNINDNSIYKTYDATTKQYFGIMYNDNHVYDRVGYEISIPLIELDYGNYYLAIQINNGDYSYQNNIINYDSYSSNLLLNNNNINYHVFTNNLYRGRIEIDVESIPSIINYAEINKPSTRNSLFSFDSFNLDAKGQLTIEGQVMIYYCDYKNKNDINFTLYIVDSANNYKEIALETIKAQINFSELLNSSFNMDYICFKCNEDLSNLENGMYKFVMKVKNGSYVDYYEPINPALIDLPNKVVNSNQFRFFTSNIRNRIMLEVK